MAEKLSGAPYALLIHFCCKVYLRRSVADYSRQLLAEPSFLLAQLQLFRHSNNNPAIVRKWARLIVLAP